MKIYKFDIEKVKNSEEFPKIISYILSSFECLEHSFNGLPDYIKKVMKFERDISEDFAEFLIKGK
jgi:hypothetical protein